MNTHMTQTVVPSLTHVGLIRLIVALLIGLTLVSSHPAYAATNIGNGTAASCTETALENALLIGGELIFNCGTNPITIKITREKVMGKNGSLDGRSKITLDGQGWMRIFFQNKNQVNNGMSFTLKNMTLTNGKSTGQDPDVGGCIYVRQSTLELVNVTLSNCKASQFGGAVRSYKATIKATNSNFVNNRAYMGAAIFSDAGNINTIITNSRFTGNSSDKNGGAVCVMGSPVSILGSTFDSNIVTGNSSEPYPGLGGAVYTQKAIPANIGTSTFRNNKAFEGGGVFIDDLSNSIITNSTFVNNSASIRGGGLDTYKSVVVVSKSTFTNNFGKEMGGGINNGTTNPLTVNTSTFLNNRTNGSGAAIANFTGPLTLNNSQILTNTAGLSYSGAPWGGGIVNFGGQLKITNVAFIGNKIVGSSSYGGALGTDTATTVVNTTFYGNEAGNGGGAVFVTKNTLTLLNTTFLANKAPNGGNIRKGNYGIVALQNSIVSKPATGVNCYKDTGGGTINNNGNNIQYGDVTCFPTLAQVNPQLDVLKNNGNNTLTLAPYSTSPAVNLGSSFCPTTDQRGYLRTDGKCDIGAYEKGATYAPLVASAQAEGRDMGEDEVKDMAEVAPKAAIACTEAALNTAIAAGGAITFSCGSSPVTIKLTTEKSLTKDTSIDGGGVVTLDGQGTIRLFYLNKDDTHDGITLTLSNITLANGKSSGDKDVNHGGCIFNRRSKVVLNNATLTGCKATKLGGAIRNLEGSVTATGSTFSNNQAAEQGGGLYSDGKTTNIIKTSIFKSNVGIVNGGAIAATETNLTVEDSTFESNSAPGTGSSTSGLGGAVFIVNWNNLSGLKTDLKNNTFNKNSATGGGAVFADANSTMNITGGSFTDNSAVKFGSALDSYKSIVIVTGSSFSNNKSEEGGAIQNGTTKLTLESVTLSDNSATRNGGAILNNAGTLTINNSTFARNKAGTGGSSNPEGGAIVSYDGTVYVTNSTFTNNEVGGSSGFGGAINSHDNFTVVNSTFNGNKAAKGGAVYGRKNTITLRNVTIAGNTTTTGGGGVAQYSSGATVALQNSILASNTPNNCLGDGNTKVTDSGNNTQSDTSCFAGKPAQDPLLDALQDNGGSTHTMALKTGSSAIDKANANACLVTDQRGAARMGTCDIGAFEFGSTATGNTTPTPTATTPVQTPTPTATPTGTAQPTSHVIMLPLIIKK